MINQFETLQRLQSFNKQIQKQLDHWTHLDKTSLSLQITHRISQLTDIENDLIRSGLITSSDTKQINHLRNLLQGLSTDPNIPKPQITFRDKSLGCKSHRSQYQTVQLQSPRKELERAMKYKRKYCCLKVQYNELVVIANRMEEEIGFLEGEIMRYKAEADTAVRRASDAHNQLENLQKQISIVKADSMNKEFLAKELKKQIERKQNSMLDRTLIQEKIKKYEQVINEMKLHYQDQSNRFMSKYQNLKQKYDVLLDEHSITKDQLDKLNRKYNQLLINFQKKTKQSTQLQDCQRYINSLEQQITLLKKEMQTQHQRQRQKFKSLQLINNRVESQRKLNKQLQKQLTASRNEKQELLDQLQEQRTMTKNIQEIALVVNNLERENRQLRTELKSNLTRAGKSQSKLRVIGELQNMVKLHKLHMKSSRMH